jgi:hypothetical protein
VGGALALDAALLLAALLLVLILVAVGIAARRFLLERGGGTVECGLRKGSGPWRLGLASYQLEDLYWFGVFRMSMRPEETFPRRDLSVVSRRLPSDAEAASLGPGMIVVECQLGEGSPEGRDLPGPGPGSGPDGSGRGSGRGSGSGGAEAMVELALAESALTGLLSWLEAAPPGSHSQRRPLSGPRPLPLRHLLSRVIPFVIVDTNPRHSTVSIHDDVCGAEARAAGGP